MDLTVLYDIFQYVLNIEKVEERRDQKEKGNPNPNKEGNKTKKRAGGGRELKGRPWIKLKLDFFEIDGIFNFSFYHPATRQFWYLR